MSSRGWVLAQELNRFHSGRTLTCSEDIPR